MRALLLAGLAALLLTAGPGQAVIGGQPDGDGHPYVVAVVSTGAGYLCTGSLISPTKVVTAAHCFTGTGDQALIGSGPGVLPFTSFGIARVDPEFCVGCGPGLPGFDSHDVAVVDLLFPIVLDRYAQLPSEGLSDGLRGTTSATIVGYGVQGFAPGPGGPTPYADFTRTAGELDIVPSRHSWRDEFLRVSGSDVRMCYGDSGGPILLGDTIVAINSYTTRMCAGVGYAYRLDTAAALGFISG